MSDKRPKKRLTDLSFLLGLTLAFTVIFFAGRWWLVQYRSAPQSLEESIGDSPTMEVGARAGMSILLDLDDEYVPLFETSHEYTLLCFFNTSCPGCTEETSTWRALAEAADVWNVSPFLVATDKEAAPIQKYVQEKDLGQFQVVYDPSGTVSAAFKIHFVPQYLLFDGDGILVHRSFGFTKAHGSLPETRAKEILAGVFKTL